VQPLPLLSSAARLHHAALPPDDTDGDNDDDRHVVAMTALTLLPALTPPLDGGSRVRTRSSCLLETVRTRDVTNDDTDDDDD
jgi:hypothetical protein